MKEKENGKWGKPFLESKNINVFEEMLNPNYNNIDSKWKDIDVNDKLDLNNMDRLDLWAIALHKSPYNSIDVETSYLAIKIYIKKYVVNTSKIKYYGQKNIDDVVKGINDKGHINFGDKKLMEKIISFIGLMLLE